MRSKGETMEKEFLYVGHYIDTEGNFVLKVGTTNDLERRRKEHNRNYLKSAYHPRDSEFEYDWYRPLSKWNTLKYEEKTKEEWKINLNGETHKCPLIPLQLKITVQNIIDYLET